MTPAQIQELAARNERIRDALLGGFMVAALKRADPDEYQRLMDYFSTRPDFIAGLDEMVDAFAGIAI